MRPGPAPGVAYAGFWIRLLAYLVDTVIVSGPLYVLAFLLLGSQLLATNCVTFGSSSTAFGSCTATATGLLYAIGFGIFLLQGVYYVILWCTTGWSLGQRLCGLRVVSAMNGARITFGRAVLRYVGYVASSAVFDLGFLWVCWDPQKQGWHDKIATTFVVRRA